MAARTARGNPGGPSNSITRRISPATLQSAQSSRAAPSAGAASIGARSGGSPTASRAIWEKNLVRPVPDGAAAAYAGDAARRSADAERGSSQGASAANVCRIADRSDARPARRPSRRVRPASCDASPGRPRHPPAARERTAAT